MAGIDEDIDRVHYEGNGAAKVGFRYDNFQILVRDLAQISLINDCNSLQFAGYATQAI